MATRARLPQLPLLILLALFGAASGAFLGTATRARAQAPSESNDDPVIERLLRLPGVRASRSLGGTLVSIHLQGGELSREVVDALPTLDGLTVLYIDGDEGGGRVRDFRFLTRLRSLRRLHLRRVPLANLRPLSGMRELRELSLSETGATDLRPLSRLRELRVLELVSLPASDLRPLSRLFALGTLRISNLPVRDLRPLSGLRALRHLDLSHTSAEDLGPLARLRALRHLDLSQTQARDLRPLSGLRELRRLILTQAPVQDLRPLARLPELRRVDLDAGIRGATLRAACDLRRREVAVPSLSADRCR